MLRTLRIAAAVVAFMGCSKDPAPEEHTATPADEKPPSYNGSSEELPSYQEWTVDLGATCDMSRSGVRDGQSLVVRDPTVLSRFALRRVVMQILKSAGHADADPLAFIQRMFDTENATSGAAFADGVHCDAATNGAFANAAAVDCPRAEGALASSNGIFTSGDPDYFAPVALVHRFDLIGTSLRTCGEYRIVYAKASGLTDPSNRVLINFEGALENPNRSLAACRPVAQKLARWDYGTPDADEIDRFYFSGGDGLLPVVRAESYGLGSNQCNYAGECGQIRVALGMQEPFDFRELRFVADQSPF